VQDPYASPAIVQKYLATEKPLPAAEWEFLTSHLDKQATLCDVGFGSGGVLSQLLDAGYLHLSGLDSSGPFVSHARERFGGRVGIHQADLTRDEPTLHFDAVIAYHVITAIQQPHQRRPVLLQISRMVHPQGLLITKSFWSTVDKTVTSVQEGVSLNIWIPKNEDFCRTIISLNWEWIDSALVDKDGFPQIINVFRKR